MYPFEVFIRASRESDPVQKSKRKRTIDIVRTRRCATRVASTSSSPACDRKRTRREARVTLQAHRERDERNAIESTVAHRARCVDAGAGWRSRRRSAPSEADGDRPCVLRVCPPFSIDRTRGTWTDIRRIHAWRLRARGSLPSKERNVRRRFARPHPLRLEIPSSARYLEPRREGRIRAGVASRRRTTRGSTDLPRRRPLERAESLRFDASVRRKDVASMRARGGARSATFVSDPRPSGTVRIRRSNAVLGRTSVPGPTRNVGSATAARRPMPRFRIASRVPGIDILLHGTSRGGTMASSSAYDRIAGRRRSFSLRTSRTKPRRRPPGSRSGPTVPFRRTWDPERIESRP